MIIPHIEPVHVAYEGKSGFMCDDKTVRNLFPGYTCISVQEPDYEYVQAFVYPDEKVVYLNLAAAPDANCIKLMRSVGND